MLDSAAAFFGTVEASEGCVCVYMCVHVHAASILSNNTSFERQILMDKPALCNLLCTS